MGNRIDVGSRQTLKHFGMSCDIKWFAVLKHFHSDIYTRTFYITVTVTYILNIKP